MLLLATHVGLLALFDLGRAPAAFLALFACAFATYVWASLRLERTARVALILGVACLLRLLLVPLPATLSDDILRYQWDGRVLTAGFNPYRWAPEHDTLRDLRDDLWIAMPHKHVPTVYPPLALGLFSIASLTPSPALAIKLALVMADLLACWLLIGLARRRGDPAGRALWYAWNPLPVLEIAGMGHVDGLMVPLMVAAVAWVHRRRAGAALRAGGAAAAAVLVKIVPIVALPLWARASRHPARFLLLAGAVLAAGVLPVAVATDGVPPGLVTYGVSWEFNGPLYEPLWRAFDRAELDVWAKERLDAAKARYGRHEQINHLYPFVYPQLLAKLALAGVLGILWLLALRSRDPVAGTLAVFAGVIACAATVYPWYLLWLLPWAALLRHPAALTLSFTMVFSYWPQLTDVPLMPWGYLAVWLPCALVLIGRRWSSS